jgi:hypothetical protein
VADKRPEPDPIQTQRMLVYTIVGLLCLSGLILAAAMADPCAAHGGDAKLELVGKRCSDVVAFGDYLPKTAAWIAVAIILAANVLFYELRFLLRVYGVAAIGAFFVINAAVIAADGLPIVLVTFYALFGIAMMWSAYGIHRERREGWAAALSMSAVLLTGHFFGTAKIAQETGWPIAYALLPSMALMLPLVIALLTSPPGATPVKPFATRSVAPAPQSAA